MERIGKHRVSVRDNGGKTIDRYTVVYLDIKEGPRLYESLGMSDRPFHPQGVGQHCTAMAGKHLGRLIAFADLPSDCQKAVRQDLGL